MCKRINATGERFRKESQKEKVTFAICQLVCAIAFLTMGGIMAKALISAKDIDNTLCAEDSPEADSCARINNKIYDNMYINGPFTDEGEAQDLMDKLTSVRENPSGDFDSHFTTIYMMSSITLLVTGGANLVMVAGAWVLVARYIGMCFLFLGLLGTFVAVIVTGTFRFATQGKLAALSETPSRLDSSTMKLIPDGRVYADDATMVLAIFICQIIFLCGQFCFEAAQEEMGSGGQEEGAQVAQREASTSLNRKDKEDQALIRA